MALNKTIITAAEADAILALETEWLALTDPVKEYHIALASVYMQTQWTCTSVDWDDDTTISEELEEACAYYALASANGNLYADAKAENVAKGMVKEETSKLGSLSDSIKYCCNSGNQTLSPLMYPDTLMGTECSLVRGLGSVKLTRV